jgi:hypothetical protein
MACISATHICRPELPQACSSGSHEVEPSPIRRGNRAMPARQRRARSSGSDASHDIPHVQASSPNCLCSENHLPIGRPARVVERTFQYGLAPTLKPTDDELMSPSENDRLLRARLQLDPCVPGPGQHLDRVPACREDSSQRIPWAHLAEKSASPRGDQRGTMFRSPRPEVTWCKFFPSAPIVNT